MPKSLEDILSSAEEIEVEPGLARLIDAYLNGIAEAYRRDPGSERAMPFDVALAALFDLCANALYAQRVVTSGWIFCGDKSAESDDGHFAGHYLYYPFVSACPRCSVKGRFHKADPQKPKSGSIGDMNSMVIAAIYSRIAKASPEKAEVYRVPGTGDADLIFSEGDNICLAEIKASPLVSYPLAVRRKEPITYLDDDTGEALVNDHHKNATPPDLEYSPLYLYLPHVGEYVDLGSKKGDGWPLDTLASYVSRPEGAMKVAGAWQRLLEVYSDRGGLWNNDNARWLVNSCGKPRGAGFEISNGKNMPGIDRTDDLKKGTYQVLKMGAVYKEHPKKKVRTALVANIHAIVHEEVYVAEIADVVWVKDPPGGKYVTGKTEEEWTVKSEGVFNLFDGIICLTGSKFRDDWLESVADANHLRNTL
ncbi:MAG: hypothetical protein H0V75_10445 [Rubrobacter sp.]|nr:hypothetical protein [Rubrobacter sp.]